jgi:hypothetical protein
MWYLKSRKYEYKISENRSYTCMYEIEDNAIKLTNYGTSESMFWVRFLT